MIQIIKHGKLPLEGTCTNTDCCCEVECDFRDACKAKEGQDPHTVFFIECPFCEARLYVKEKE